MEDAKLTGLLVSFFHEESVFHEALKQIEHCETVKNLKNVVSKLMKDKYISQSELHSISNIINNVVSIRNQVNLSSSLPIEYPLVTEAIFTSFLNFPCFVTWENNTGDYFLKIPVPATPTNDFVRTSKLLDKQFNSGILKTPPAPGLVAQLFRQGESYVFPSLEIEVKSNLNGQQDGRTKYHLQTVICLTSANSLLTYVREETKRSEKKWKIIKQNEWNRFSVHDLHRAEKDIQFVNNLKNLEQIPIHRMPQHILYMMAKCLFLIYVPVQHQETLSEAVAIIQSNDQPVDQVSSLQNTAQQCNLTQAHPPYTLEILDSLLSLIKSYHRTFTPIMEGVIEKFQRIPGMNINQLNASNLLGCIDWTNTTSFSNPQFYIVWSKLTQLALGTDRFRINASCILLDAEGDANSTIQHLYNSHENDNPKINYPVGLTISLRRSCTGMQRKYVGIDTQIVTEASDESQTLKLIYVICFVEGEGIITYMVDATQNCWTKKLPNGNVHNLETLITHSRYLEFTSAEESGSLHDTQVVQQHSIGVVYAPLDEPSSESA